MVSADDLRTAGKVLFRSLCTAGGILAPAVVGVPTTGDLWNLLAGLGAGALGMLGTWRINVETEEAQAQARKNLPETAALLRNHDLNVLVAAALERALGLAAEDASFRAHRILIESLAREVPGYFRDIERGPADALIKDILPNIIIRFAQGPERVLAESHADLQPWEACLISSLVARFTPGMRLTFRLC